MHDPTYRFIVNTDTGEYLTDYTLSRDGGSFTWSSDPKKAKLFYKRGPADHVVRAYDKQHEGLGGNCLAVLRTKEIADE